MEIGSGCTRNAVDGYYHPSDPIALNVTRKPRRSCQCRCMTLHSAEPGTTSSSIFGDVFVRRSWTLCLEIFRRGMIYMRGLVPFPERFWMDNRDADMEVIITLLHPIIYVYIVMLVAREL
jgi:hypothetical protein